MTWRLAVLIGAAALAGCTPGACDPSQAGFLSGIGCEASGSYGQRSAALQTQLQSSRASALQERANALDAQQDAAASQGELARSRQRLRSIDSQNATLQRRLATLRASNRVDQGRLAGAQSQLAELSRRRASLGARPDDASVRDLERQQHDLEGVVRGLSDL